MSQLEFTLIPEEGRPSLFGDLLPTLETINDYAISRGRAIDVARRLQGLGIDVHDIGRFSISASVSDDRFESLFSTTLEPVSLGADIQVQEGYAAKAPRRRVEIPTDADLNRYIERVYIQHDPILMAPETSLPPLTTDKFRLRVPGDIAQLMEAAPVHRKGVTGSGVRVAMVDSGFYHHPYLVHQGYDLLSVAAPDITEPETDSSGHGTGESANLFATAPGINFVGVKMGNPTLAFRTAARLDPQVITCSWGYHVDEPGTQMPNWLMPLHAEVLHAVSRDITVCFSAGNGHLAFPANMPEVLAVGGVFIDENGRQRASNYASGFESTWFPGRKVPDVCGLVGEQPEADYIILPVPHDSVLDHLGTGWGTFSGTSAASPMVAGVCALLKQTNPDLLPYQVKQILQYTAIDIIEGECLQGHKATPGPDLATGYGLVNAKRALDVLT